MQLPVYDIWVMAHKPGENVFNTFFCNVPSNYYLICNFATLLKKCKLIK